MSSKLTIKFLLLAWVISYQPVAADVANAVVESTPSLTVRASMRTLYIEAYDTMRYSLDSLAVTPGETVRFIVTNKGTLPHEFSVGTPDAQVAHAAQMAQAYPEHGHGAAIDLRPGETKEMLWTFADPSSAQIACHYPGHFEAGMKVAVKVR